MDVFYEMGKLPPDAAVVDTVRTGTRRLEEKLRGLDVDALAISDYNKRYLREKLRSLRGSLQLNSHLLSWVLYQTGKPAAQTVLLDYGGGSGTLSLLARAIGFGTVVYNDIYEVSGADARTVGQAIGLEADAYVVGDTNDVVAAFKSRGLTCDAVVSYDVIEHVYDIEKFFREIAQLAQRRLTLVLGSGANDANPKIRRDLERQHLVVELKDREPVEGQKDRDTLRSYLSLRRELIGEHAKKIGSTGSASILDVLAARTRGMAGEDITRAVEHLKATGELPAAPRHRTNTCDPRNGNWAEHLMTADYLRGLLGREGFEGEIVPGFWPSSTNPAKEAAVLGLNSAISLLGPRGLPLAPFYVVMATHPGR
ncbi:MAG: class I SAM-dependent methyltransferase [Archangiaceae bacterium]|nr:class I SAM-dependent methyltransferase [Archangiaceae bacterium]